MNLLDPDVLLRNLVSQKTLRRVVLAATLLFAAALAPRIAASPGRPVMFAALLAGIAGAIVLLRYPALGLVALIPAGIFIPMSIGTGSQTPINVAVLLLVGLLGIWLLDMIVRRRVWVFPSKPFLPLIVFATLSALSFLFGQIRWLEAQPASQRAQFAGLAIFLLCFAAVFVVAHLVKSLSVLQWMTWAFILAGAVYILSQVLPSWSAIGGLVQVGATGGMLWTWLAAMIFSQLLLNRSLPRLVQAGLALIMLAFLYSAFVTRQAWTSAWMPSTAAIFVILLIKRPRLLFVGGAAFLLAAIIYYDQFASLVMVGDNEYSLMTRLDAWAIMLEIIRLNPFFGVGPANYYWYTALYPIRGYYVPFNSHNNYIDIVAQTGFLGLFAYFWFLWETGRLGVRLLGQAPDGFARAYVVGCIGGLAGMVVSGMLGDWVIPFLYNVGMEGFRSSMIGWLFLGGLIALEKMILLPEYKMGEKSEILSA